MPNWCENELTVSGPTDEVACFVVTAKKGSQRLSFQSFVPCPPELEIESGGYGSIGYDAWYGDPERILAYPWVVKAGVTTVEELREFLDLENPLYRIRANQYAENIKKYGAPTWYEWRLKRWGTKWDTDDEILIYSEKPGRTRFDFTTAWTPPIPVVQAMAEQFPLLEFTLQYWEGGSGFQGVLHAAFGEVVEDNHYPYDGPRGG